MMIYEYCMMSGCLKGGVRGLRTFVGDRNCRMVMGTSGEVAQCKNKTKTTLDLPTRGTTTECSSVDGNKCPRIYQSSGPCNDCNTAREELTTAFRVREARERPSKFASHKLRWFSSKRKLPCQLDHLAKIKLQESCSSDSDVKVRVAIEQP